MNTGKTLEDLSIEVVFANKSDTYPSKYQQRVGNLSLSHKLVVLVPQIPWFIIIL